MKFKVKEIIGKIKLSVGVFSTQCAAKAGLKILEKRNPSKKYWMVGS